MNKDKAETVLIAIKADLSRHDQTLWTNIYATPGYTAVNGTVYDGIGEPKVKETENQIINCGTTACLAGHTGFIFAPVGTKFYRDNMVLPGQTRAISYEDFASDELEFSQDEANYLFSGSRSIGEIEGYLTASPQQQEDILDVADEYYD